MSNEEFEKRFEKKMEFLVDQQAQFAANMQKMEERVSKVEEHVSQIRDLLTRLAVVTTAGFKELTEKVSVVVDAQIRTEGNVSSLAEKVGALTQRMTELAEAQAHTDQRLNVIIDIISEGRNGRSRN